MARGVEVETRQQYAIFDKWYNGEPRDVSMFNANKQCTQQLKCQSVQEKCAGEARESQFTTEARSGFWCEGFAAPKKSFQCGIWSLLHLGPVSKQKGNSIHLYDSLIN